MEQFLSQMSIKSSVNLKSKFVLYFSIVGILVFSTFGIVSITSGNVFFGVVELAAAFLSLLNVLLFKVIKKTNLAASVIVTIAAVVLVGLFVNGGISNTALFWMPAFPILAFFLFDKQKGSYFSIAFLGVLVAITILNLFEVINLPFTLIELRQFFASYLVITILIFFYEMISQDGWKKLDAKTKELELVNQKLDKEATFRQQTQQSTEKNVAELEDTKKAMLNIMEDLQDQQTKLARGKAKDEAMLLSIGDGLIATDEKGYILVTNPPFEKMLGWSQQEVVGKKLSDIVSLIRDDKEVSEENRLINLTLKSGATSKTKQKNIFYKTKSGQKLPVSITVSPILIEGKVVGAIQVFRDITKENEIDKAKTEFVSLASHQLKTPLSAINWYSELMTSEDAGKLNKQQAEYMREIANGSQRMVDLVNALLNVSRLELGTFSIEPTEVNLLATVRSVLDELKQKVDEKNLKIVEKHADIPAISADANLSRIIIQNILTNAVKYTPENGSIEIGLSQVKEGEVIGKKKIVQDAVLYSVTDTGYGIPEKQQKKIFTKLFRADNVQEKDTDGTGLGLYIIKSILDAFGGQIWFESIQDKGTTFYITIPLTGMSQKKGTRTLEVKATSKV